MSFLPVYIRPVSTVPLNNGCAARPYPAVRSRGHESQWFSFSYASTVVRAAPSRRSRVAHLLTSTAASNRAVRHRSGRCVLRRTLSAHSEELRAAMLFAVGMGPFACILGRTLSAHSEQLRAAMLFAVGMGRCACVLLPPPSVGPGPVGATEVVSRTWR